MNRLLGATNQKHSWLTKWHTQQFVNSKCFEGCIYQLGVWFWPLRQSVCFLQLSPAVQQRVLIWFWKSATVRGSMAALNKSKPCGLLSAQPLRTSPAHKSLIFDLPSIHFQYPLLPELLMNIKHLNRSRLLIFECRQMSFYTGSSYTGGQNKTKQMCLQACRGALIRLQRRKIHLLLARLTYIYIFKTTTHSAAEWARVYLCVCGWWWWWGFTILIR